MNTLKTPSQQQAGDPALFSRPVLMIVSAPSGAGKTTLIRHLLKKYPRIHLSVSYTTRPPREGEVDGRDYHFVDEAYFRALINKHQLAEYAIVHDHFYGTPRHSLDEQLSQGRDVIVEIDWQGARLIRAAYPQAASVFILPPALSVLEDRLRKRGTDSEAVIIKRMQQAREAVVKIEEYTYAIVNDNFDEAELQLESTYKAEKQRVGPALIQHIRAIIE